MRPPRLWILFASLLLAAIPAIADNPSTCIGDPWAIDSDGDGHFDECDNCVSIPKANQANADGDNRGDVCDNCPITSNPSQPSGPPRADFSLLPNFRC